MRPAPSTAPVAASTPPPDRVALERGLTIARRARGMTFVAVPAAVAPAASLVGVQPDVNVWSSPDGLVVVGIGAAHTLRASGESRWRDLVRDARAIVVDGAVIGGASMPIDALDKARPRFLGAGEFAIAGDAWFVLPRWTYVRDGATAQLVLAIDPRDANDAERWHAELASIRAALAAGFVAHAQPSLVELAPAEGAQYREQVVAITNAIAHGAVTKIVAARTCEVTLASEIRLADLFAALDARHAECVRVLLHPSANGALVAATPERLLKKRGALVECDALAGTVATDQDREAALLESAKDRREHEIVIAGIRDVFAEIGADVVVAPTAIRALRHVLHLHASIRATLRAADDAHVLDLVARLHPTPAVGGTPTRVAVDWIAQHEPTPRGWYAGPIGWFDLAGDGEFAVAIRSGVIDGARAKLWAGAGIVAGSDPDRELAETDNKLRAVLGALGVTP